MRSERALKERLLKIESSVIWSKEEQGEWKALVWALELDRDPPWEGDG